MKLPSALHLFIKTIEIAVLLCRKSRIFEINFTVIQLSCKPKCYGRHALEAELEYLGFLKFQSKCTVLDFCLHSIVVVYDL